MATAEKDISATLDEIELENLVSLLQDDAVFQGLHELDLSVRDPLDPAQNDLMNFDNSRVLDSSDVDMFDFHDALDFFSDENAETSTVLNNGGPSTGYDTGYLSNSTVNYWNADHMGPNLATLSNNEQLSNNVLQELLANDEGGVLSDGRVNTIGTNEMFSTATPTATTPPTYEPDLTTKQANVHHDHTYAKKEPVSHSSMLTNLSALPSAADVTNSKNSDTEEGSSSDTGYDDNMSSTSPASTRSSFSSTQELAVSPEKASPRHLIHSDSPTATPVAPTQVEFTELVKDPVKLIDERIKFFMSRQEVDLTEEEKETLKSEGLPIPTTLPLTRTEEKALKSVRRKIRNKLAAQESRKKKKVYMNCLEEQVEKCTKENRMLHKKVETLETENRTLLQQLAHLQTLVAAANPIFGRRMNMGTCLMVVVLCFGVLCGNLLPYRVSMATANDYSTSAVRSRALLSVDATQSKWTSWSDFYSNLFTGYKDSYYKPSVSSHHDSSNSNSVLLNTLWLYCHENNNTLHNDSLLIRV